MKYIIVFFLSIYSLGNTTVAQNNPEGFFSSESKSIVIGNEIIVSIKKYNATDEQLKKLTNKKSSKEMTYLDLPIDATNISLNSRDFESMLYCFDMEGKIKWEKSIGFSKFSWAAPITTDSTFSYVGEALSDDKAQILKIDSNGNVVWKKEIDSVQVINAIHFSNNKLVALSSFEVNRKKESVDKKSFSYHTFPVYFHLEINEKDGSVINNEYQHMANYMSSLGFSNPYIASDYSYYLNNKDSVVYFNINQQKSATVVSQGMPKDCKVQQVIATENSNHYVTLSRNENQKPIIQLFTDYYTINKKYNIELNVTNTSNSFPRYFLINNKPTSVAALICFENKVNIFMVDNAGKITSTETPNLKINDIVTSVGVVMDQLYSVQVNGRETLGKKGQLSIKYY
ncbi:MAG: hypothetical protein KA319_06145 [Ferruginibacter sp.]|nr:hypothetical protein [Ferruginibacter sp.]